MYRQQHMVDTCRRSVIKQYEVYLLKRLLSHGFENAQAGAEPLAADRRKSGLSRAYADCLIKRECSRICACQTLGAGLYLSIFSSRRVRLVVRLCYQLIEDHQPNRDDTAYVNGTHMQDDSSQMKAAMQVRVALLLSVLICAAQLA